jgi:hypothetical protein
MIATRREGALSLVSICYVPVRANLSTRAGNPERTGVFSYAAEA